MCIIYKDIFKDIIAIYKWYKCQTHIWSSNNKCVAQKKKSLEPNCGIWQVNKIDEMIYMIFE